MRAWYHGWMAALWGWAEWRFDRLPWAQWPRLRRHWGLIGRVSWWLNGRRCYHQERA